MHKSGTASHIISTLLHQELWKTLSAVVYGFFSKYSTCLFNMRSTALFQTQDLWKAYNHPNNQIFKGSGLKRGRNKLKTIWG